MPHQPTTINPRHPGVLNLETLTPAQLSNSAASSLLRPSSTVAGSIAMWATRPRAGVSPSPPGPPSLAWLIIALSASASAAMRDDLNLNIHGGKPAADMSSAMCVSGRRTESLPSLRIPGGLKSASLPGRPGGAKHKAASSAPSTSNHRAHAACAIRTYPVVGRNGGSAIAQRRCAWIAGNTIMDALTVGVPPCNVTTLVTAMRLKKIAYTLTETRSNPNLSSRLYSALTPRSVTTLVVGDLFHLWRPTSSERLTDVTTVNGYGQGNFALVPRPRPRSKRAPGPPDPETRNGSPCLR